MKAELISTALYAEGRPRDVGTDRALANNLNVYQDQKSAKNHTLFWSSAFSGDDTGFRAIPLFFGTESASSTIVRDVTVRPFIRSTTGATATFIITLTDTWPSYAPGAGYSTTVWTPNFSGKYSQATWSTTNTTFFTGDPQTLSLGVRDLIFGFAFLVIEANGGTFGAGIAQMYGLTMREGARTAI